MTAPISLVTRQLNLDVHHELLIDNFAGGGGASCGIEMATGRRVDVAINHDQQAVAMHVVNHPETRHYCESVWDIDPREVTQGRPVGLVWLSPDCKHFSRAKGGKPVEKKIRGLAWVALRWAATANPRVIMLENVEEFLTWGPLVEGPGGELRPCPKRSGRTFEVFVNALRRQGYAVEWRTLRACDYGAPTIRKRLFLIARRDGQPIVWPAPTHADPKTAKAKKLLPWRTAAECIDFCLPCPSIFERARPLADATLRRIAVGVMRYVVNSAEPFIIPVSHSGDSRVHNIGDPLRTITGSSRSTHALVSAFIAKHYGDRGQLPGSEMSAPVSTVTARDHNALVTAKIVGVDHRSSGDSAVWSADKLVTTITAEARHALVASSLIKLRNNCIGQDSREPLHTITGGAEHFAEVRAFMTAYYGSDQDPRLEEPMHTVTSRDRFSLVTVAGQDYEIADIGMRMLQPRELFRAQGFPADYIIGDDPEQGLTLTKTAQIRMVGNSVCPPVAAALVRANLAEMAIKARRVS